MQGFPGGSGRSWPVERGKAMIPTIHGLITIVIGIWLLTRGGVMPVLLGALAAGVFDASAAVALPALGGSTIPPSRVMLVFLLIAMARAVGKRTGLLADALRNNGLLLLFALWGMVAAFTLPFVFAGQAQVVPMAAGDQIVHLYDVFPLRFTPQNITTPVYMLGTALTAMTAYVAGRTSLDPTAIVRLAVALAWVQVATGLASITLAGTAWDSVVDFIRNGNYGQLDQYFGGFRRMDGVMSEPSSFAGFTFVWFVVCFESWLRDVEPKRTGPAALAAFVVMMISTSTTAYATIAIYGAIVAIRLVADARNLRITKVAMLVVLGLVGLAAVMALMIANPTLAAWAKDLLEVNTIKKAGSASGLQRAFWARQGIDMFVLSHGLGVGPGTFRSSGFVQSVIGSCGVIGAGLLLGYLVQFAIVGQSRAASQDKMRLTIARIAGWAAVAVLIPISLSGPSPDPGAIFAALAGFSIGLRRPFVAPPKRRAIRKGQWNADPAREQARSAIREAPAVPRPDAWRHRAR